MNNATWQDVQREQNGLRITGALAILSFIIGIFAMFYSVMHFHGSFIGMWLFVVAFIFMILFVRRVGHFRSMYKSIVVAKAAENLFDRYEYFPKNGFSYEEIRASGIMAMGNRYKSEDTIEGSYKNVSFRRADMYIAQHTSNGKSSHTTVYLRGTWMTFSYNKTFQSDLQILSKDFSFSNTHTSRLFTRAADRRHTFVTEDMAFNEAFTCTCQDESEAFYLLTPRIMQMLLLLRTEIGKPFMLGFVDNRLHFVISSHEDHMEPSVFGKCDLNVEVEKVRRELMVIRNVIDSLAMDRQLFE